MATNPLLILGLLGVGGLALYEATKSTPKSTGTKPPATGFSIVHNVSTGSLPTARVGDYVQVQVKENATGKISLVFLTVEKIIVDSGADASYNPDAKPNMLFKGAVPIPAGMHFAVVATDILAVLPKDVIDAGGVPPIAGKDLFSHKMSATDILLRPSGFAAVAGFSNILQFLDVNPALSVSPAAMVDFVGDPAVFQTGTFEFKRVSPWTEGMIVKTRVEALSGVGAGLPVGGFVAGDFGGTFGGTFGGKSPSFA